LPLRRAIPLLLALLVGLSGCGDDGGRRAVSADRFVNSIGVNVHMSYSDTAYANVAEVRRALAELGIRHVRDGVVLGRDDQYKALSTLAGDGVHADLILGNPGKRLSSDTLAAQLATLKRDLVGVAESVEGPNEYDASGDPDFARSLRRYQLELFQRVRDDPGLHGLAVIGPSLIDVGKWTAVGDLGAALDMGNIHPYPGGRPPTPSLLSDQLAAIRPSSRSKPVVATETGYHNAMLPPPGQQAGVSRTFLYELADEKPEPAGRDPEQHFGLVRSNFSRKPAFSSLRNMITLLKDPGPGFEPGSLDFSVKAGQPISRLLLEKRDGRFYLVLWRADAATWSIEQKLDLRPPPAAVEVRFGQDVGAVRSYSPVQSTQATETWNGPGSVKLQIAADPLILEIEKR
jgi:hypothetical protein